MIAFILSTWGTVYNIAWITDILHVWEETFLDPFRYSIWKYCYFFSLLLNQLKTEISCQS